MKIKYKVCIAIVVFLIQLSIPVKIIYEKESVLLTGIAHKFKMRPIDPSDPFRGKYIILKYEENKVETLDTNYVRGNDIYLKIEKDNEGYAKATQVQYTPFNDETYIKTKVKHYNKETQLVYFDLPFERFYMEESKAYDAELAYNEVIRDTSNNMYAMIYIKKGKGVLDNVMVNEMPIQDFTEKNKSGTQ